MDRKLVETSLRPLHRPGDDTLARPRPGRISRLAERLDPEPRNILRARAMLQGHPSDRLTFDVSVWIQPGSSRSRITGIHGDPPRLKIQIAAPAVEGAANEELLL